MSRVYNEKFDEQAFKIEFSIVFSDARDDMFEPYEMNFVAGPYADMKDVNACIKRVQSGRDNKAWRLRWEKGTVTYQIYKTHTNWEPVEVD